MKKALLFVILMLVVAVWLSAMVCVVTGAELSPKWLALAEPYVCPPGTKIQVEQMRQSYHEPGETSLSISCIGDGIDQDVTIEAGLALWVVFFLLSVPVAALLTLGGWLLFRWRRRAVQAQMAVQVSGQTVSAVVHEGQSYTNVDDMPPHVREAYEKAMTAFSDADGDGIPDILQGGAQVIDLRKQRQEGGGVQRLKELKEMLDAGLITLEEYEAKKNEILTEL
jgi:hypothetical protein